MRRATAVLAAGLWLASCTYGASVAPTLPRAAPSPAPDRGKVVFLRDCAWCHGNRGEGTERAPDLEGPLDGPAYTDFMLGTGRMPLADPEEPAVRSEPAYDRGTISDLVSYVASLGGDGPPVPEPDPAAGDVALGAELYLENCAACHSSTGVGGALTSGRVAPSVLRSTAVEIAEAMLVGPGCVEGSRTCEAGEGAMPVFQLEDDEVDSIVAYIQTLQRRQTRGGDELGRLGPVTEGAVAWLIGLVAMVGFARLIGTRVGS